MVTLKRLIGRFGQLDPQENETNFYLKISRSNRMDGFEMADLACELFLEV